MLLGLLSEKRIYGQIMQSSVKSVFAPAHCIRSHCQLKYGTMQFLLNLNLLHISVVFSLQSFPFLCGGCDEARSACSMWDSWGRFHFCCIYLLPFTSDSLSLSYSPAVSPVPFLPVCTGRYTTTQEYRRFFCRRLFLCCLAIAYIPDKGTKWKWLSSPDNIIH